MSNNELVNQGSNRIRRRGEFQNFALFFKRFRELPNWVLGMRDEEESQVVIQESSLSYWMDGDTIDHAERNRRGGRLGPY